MITQIYEIQTPEEAEKCIAIGVDRIGSVLLSGDMWKQPLIKDVIGLSNGTGVQNSLIPLFSGDDLYRALDYYRPHFLHFCESLTDHSGGEIRLEGFLQTQRDLKDRFPEIGIVRSIPIPLKGGSPDFPFLKIAGTLEPLSDCFLIDTWIGEEPVEGFVGITGKTCDWKRSRELVHQSAVPVILAGGLSPENVYEAIMEAYPAGVDSCTQTNDRDALGSPIRFKKDFSKVSGFVDETRRAEKAFVFKREALTAKLAKLREEIKEREAALPAHSVRPHQILAIEDLEDEISSVENELKNIPK